MLLYIVTIIFSSLLFVSGQSNFPGSGAYRPPPRPAQSFNGSPSYPIDPHVPPTPVPRQSEIQTPSLNPYPQPEKLPVNVLIAQIQGYGVVGYASFLQNEETLKPEIKIHITGGAPDEVYYARIFELPIQNGASCTPINVGKTLADLKDKPIIPGREVIINAAVSLLTGPNNMIGRTLMLQGKNTGVSICSVIMPGDGSKLIYIGKFHHPISGMAYFIQNELGASIGTEWMLFSDGKRKDEKFVWKLIKTDSNQDDKVNIEKNRCADLNGEVIATSSKTLLPVSTEAPIWRGRMHVGIDLRNNVLPTQSLYLVLETPDGSIFACTSLNRVDPKIGVAKFTGGEAQGVIRFTQDSPFEPTRVAIDLNIVSDAFSYGIDVLPSLKRRKQEAKRCPNVKETIYNPFHVDPDKVPAQGMGTTEMYAVGDLSGKYGALDKLKTVKLRTWDVNLPLFGYYSVIGRAIVMYGPLGPAISCTNIELDGKALNIVYATFDFPIQGQFIFRQPEGECSSDTYLYIEVSKHPNLNTDKTFNHPWHVHEKAIKVGENQLSTTDCGQAGGHFNPFNVSVASHNPIYVRDCNIFTPTRCEVGDLAHKLGHIDIPKYQAIQGKEPEVAKYYLIDSDLPLCGASKISGRSLVIHDGDFQMSRLSCANLLVYNAKN